MLPLINIQEKITLTNNNLTISAGGYTSEIDVNDITELKLLDELPYDGFLRTNGASTDSYDIGRYVDAPLENAACMYSTDTLLFS